KAGQEYRSVATPGARRRAASGRMALGEGSCRTPGKRARRRARPRCDRHGPAGKRLGGIGGLRFADPPRGFTIRPNKKRNARMKTNTKDKPVAVVIGATSKWQSDGRNTLLA